MSLGIPENRIYALPADDNWWSPGDNGPCGPCSEMFYDMNGTTGDLSHEEFLDAVNKESVIEIWNDVFMEYEKKDGKVVGKLAQKNVDTGAGLERITAVMQGKKTAYDTDIFETVIKKITEHKPGGIAPSESWSHDRDVKSIRIIADHIRACVFIISSGVFPANSKQGYVLRRLIRRMSIHIRELNIHTRPYLLVDSIVEKYKNVYPVLLDQKENIEKIINEEELKFLKTLEQGLKEFEKMYQYYFEALKLTGLSKPEEHIFMSGDDAFMLFSTYGFPIELILEIGKEKKFINIEETKKQFYIEFEKHQKLSQTSSAGMFKGGLANHNEQTIRLHTAHHLLLAALQQVLGKSVKQRGSNITEERLRIDFIFERKMTDEEKKQVEGIVNEKIDQGLNVIRREMPLVDAEKLGAEMEFGAKYPDMVSVYTIEDEKGNHFSKEFCGGPHVANTKELGKFKIQKEEAVSAGVRRIKAILE